MLHIIFVVLLIHMHAYTCMHKLTHVQLGLHSVTVGRVHLKLLHVCQHTHILYTQRDCLEMMKLYEMLFFFKLMILQISSSEPVHSLRHSQSTKQVSIANHIIHYERWLLKWKHVTINCQVEPV